MDQNAKELWLEALRSDKYERGNLLREERGGKVTYCCLGVLAEVMNVPKVETKFNYHSILAYNFDEVSEVYKATLSCPPEGFCGLTSNQIGQCIRMNDSKRMNFSEIADVIEKEF